MREQRGAAHIHLYDLVDAFQRGIGDGRCAADAGIVDEKIDREALDDVVDMCLRLIDEVEFKHLHIYSIFDLYVLRH